MVPDWSLHFRGYKFRIRMERYNNVRVKIFESNPIVSIRPLQKRLKDLEVIPGDHATFRAVGNLEKNGVLGTAQFGKIVFGSNSIYERVYI